MLAFWESREKFDAYAADRIGPAIQAGGVDIQPEIHEFPVHEYLAG